MPTMLKVHEAKAIFYLRRDDYETGATGEVEMPFNQSDWANYLCLGRSSLCRALRNLKRDGRISWTGRKFRMLKPVLLSFSR